VPAVKASVPGPSVPIAPISSSFAWMVAAVAAVAGDVSVPLPTWV
jgi:hypothetical protein